MIRYLLVRMAVTFEGEWKEAMSVCIVPPSPLESRYPTSAVEEESELRREMEEEICVRREEWEEGNEERMAKYQAQLAEWKAHQRSRVRTPTMYV